MHGPDGPVPPAVHTPRSVAVWVSADGTYRVYTRRQRTFLAALVLVAGCALAAAVARGLATGDGGVAGCTLLGLALLVAYRFQRLAVVATPGVLVLWGLRRTRHIPVGDIVRFEPPLHERSSLRHSGLRVLLTSGETVSAGVFHRSDEDADDMGLAETAELNLWLAAQKDPTGRPATLPPWSPLSGAAAVIWKAWAGLLGVGCAVMVTRVAGVLLTTSP